VGGGKAFLSIQIVQLCARRASVVSCTATGDYRKTGSVNVYHALAEVWNGSTWTVQATTHSAAHKLLAAVSCGLAGVCTAVGKNTRNITNAPAQPLAEQN